MVTTRWRRQGSDDEQVANARDSFVDLTPASESPAAQTRANWSAVQRGQDIPLIGERGYGRQEED